MPVVGASSGSKQGEIRNETEKTMLTPSLPTLVNMEWRGPHIPVYQDGLSMVFTGNKALTAMPYSIS